MTDLTRIDEHGKARMVDVSAKEVTKRGATAQAVLTLQPLRGRTKKTSMNAQRAVFLDLQGTLGGDGLGDIRDFTFYSCAVPALRLFQQIGLLSIVVTNQSHIEKGLLTYQQYEERVKELQEEIDAAETKLDAIYCCPHRTTLCTCQKPKLGMLTEAQRDFGLAFPKCFVVGDMGSSDMLMAHAAGCRSILVLTGVGESSLTEFRHTWAAVDPDFIAADVLEAAEWISRQIEKEASV